MFNSRFTTIVVELDADGIGTLLLNRPETHNAFNAVLIHELTHALAWFREHAAVIVLCLRGAGKNFCAGADLNWMKRSADLTAKESRDDAMHLAEMMHALYSFPKPTMAIVQGAVFGGGVGLVACADIVIAQQPVTFCLSEVKLGLVPAVIGPYVVKAMGARMAKRYMLSGEQFDATAAWHCGMVHECVDEEHVDGLSASLLRELLSGGPQAQQAVKAQVIDALSPIDGDIRAHTAELIARIRSSKEAQEGIDAFLNKRQPYWRND